MTEEREQMQIRLIRGIKDGSIEIKVSKDNNKSWIGKSYRQAMIPTISITILLFL